MLGQAATLAAGAYLTADCVNDVLQMSGGAVLTPMQTFALFAGEQPLSGTLSSTACPDLHAENCALHM